MARTHRNHSKHTQDRAQKHSAPLSYYLGYAKRSVSLVLLCTVLSSIVAHLFTSDPDLILLAQTASSMSTLLAILLFYPTFLSDPT